MSQPTAQEWNSRKVRNLVRLGVSVFGAFVLPLIVSTVYLESTHFQPPAVHDELDSDVPVVFACLTLGIVSVLVLPCRLLYRILAVVLYVPAFGHFFLMYWMCYEMSRTGKWL